jgi:vacuolar-type H+-ATPase subunit I/STV1
MKMNAEMVFIALVVGFVSFTAGMLYSDFVWFDIVARYSCEG